MLDETDCGARRHPCPVGQQARCLQHQIVGLSRQRTRQRSIETERQAVVVPCFDLIGQVDEGHKRVELMVAVITAADDVQPRFVDGNRRAFLHLIQRHSHGNRPCVT